MGKTGGDGIHYNSESSEAWARAIQRDLDIKIALSRREAKLSSFFAGRRRGGELGGAAHLIAGDEAAGN